MVFALLCSSVGYWWWAVASDGFNLKKWLLERFPISISLVPDNSRAGLASLGQVLRRELRKHYVYKDNKGRIGNYSLPDCDEQVLAIDSYLARVIPGLSLELLQDIRSFNAAFSRVSEGMEPQGEEPSGVRKVAEQRRHPYQGPSSK